MSSVYSFCKYGVLRGCFFSACSPVLVYIWPRADLFLLAVHGSCKSQKYWILLRRRVVHSGCDIFVNFSSESHMVIER